MELVSRPRRPHTVGNVHSGFGALVVGMVLVASGCGSQPDESGAGRGLWSAEIAWAGDLALWQASIDVDLWAEQTARTDLVDHPDRYREATPPLGRCSERLSREVGSGPTDRTDALATRLASSCLRLERAVTFLANVSASGDDQAGRFVAAVGELDAAVASFGETWAALEDLTLVRGDLPVAPWPHHGSRIDPVLGDAAMSTIEGFDTEVRCWSGDDWETVTTEEAALSNGYITIDNTGAFASTEAGINMQAVDCDLVGEVTASGEWWPADAEARLDLAWALGTLAHEAQHIAGARDEAETECRGQQRVADIAGSLGAPTDRARALADLGWRELYPEGDADYRTAECRDGGPFDLRPGSSGIWPWS